VDDLTVAQNVLLSYHGARHISALADLDEAAELITPYDLPFGPSAAVADLGPGSKQLARLEQYIKTALEQGTAVLYVTHRLDEVERAASRLSVLRDGVLQGQQCQDGGWSAQDIVALMVGAPTSQVFPPKAVLAPEAATTLEVTGFRGPRFGPVDLLVRAGEIIGIAGAKGNGQRELVRSLAGLLRGRGRVTVGGKPADLRSPRVALAVGVTFQSGDRAAEPVFAELSVMENSTAVLRRDLGRPGL
jgi:ribose transport system ATP-binding protein